MIASNGEGVEAELSLMYSILLTKLQRPPVAPDIVPRVRLLARLEEGRHRPLTLISAPAGYGKSTLASRWAAVCDCPSGWVSLDEKDSDLRTFLSYVLAALRSLFPAAELQTEALLEASQQLSVPVVARYLLNDLHEIADPFIFVLDDYHYIHTGTPVNELLAEILAHPPQSMHLVLLTRRDPALPISRLRGLGQLTEIRVADLRFSPAEALEFLSEKLNVPVDEATAALLDEKTEGWVTGLRLAGLYLQGQDDPKQRAIELGGSSRHIAEYLIAEVLARQSPEIVAGLLETSILDRFCTPLCQALSTQGRGRQDAEPEFDAQRFIDWLVAAGLFVIPLDEEGYWFRYHHLFQDFLQALLCRRASSESIARLHMQASTWLAENGLIDEAIRHALAAGETQAAVRLVIEHRYELMNSSQFARLSRWLQSLPEDAMAEDPLLLTTQALVSLEYGPHSSVLAWTERAHQVAAALPAEHPDAAMFHGELAVLQSVGDLMLGQPASALAHAQNALRSLPEQAKFFRSMAVAVVAGSLQAEGNASQGVAIMRDSLADPSLPASMRVRMWFYLCIVTFMDADSSGVLLAGRECLNTPGSTQFAHTRSCAQYLLGAVHYLRNELAETRRFLADIMRQREVSQASYVAQASGILAFIHLAEGCPDEAGRALEWAGMDSWQMPDFALAAIEALPVELALRQGKIDEARRLSVGVDFDRCPPHWYLYVPQLTRIKLLLAEGTRAGLSEAHTRLAELDEQMGRIHRKNVRIDILALLALVCHRMGDEAVALEKLRAALDLAEPGGWVRNFVDLGAPMRVLVERLDQVHPGDEHTQHVLQAFRAEAVRGSISGPQAEKRPRRSGQEPDAILTPREIELLDLLAEGLSNKEIAARLFISTETVKTHLQNIYKKLKASGRMGALKEARKLGLIPHD